MRTIARIAASILVAATLIADSPLETESLDMARCPHAIRQVG